MASEKTTLCSVTSITALYLDIKSAPKMASDANVSQIMIGNGSYVFPQIFNERLATNFADTLLLLADLNAVPHGNGLRRDLTASGRALKTSKRMHDTLAPVSQSQRLVFPAISMSRYGRAELSPLNPATEAMLVGTLKLLNL